MLKPEQMETLPVGGLCGKAVRELPEATALVGDDGKVAGVVMSPAVYADWRSAFYDFAAGLAEDVTVLGMPDEQRPPRPADWAFPQDGPPPPMKDVLAYLMEQAERSGSESGGGADDVREAA